MSTEVQIYLNENVYAPGQTIVGRVECNFHSNQKIGGIKVKFSGRCTTSWTESETYYDDFYKEDRTRNVDYSGEEIYFDNQINLIGSTTLPSGRHVYDFSYKLGDVLPSNYKGPYEWGCVQYRVKAVVDRGWKFNSKAMVAFTVISPLDLNYVPGIKEPVHISLDKVLCSCCCTNNDVLTFKFSLPSTGYIPGQDVAIGACIENLTNASVEAVKFKITEITEFKAKSPSTSFKHNKEIIAANISGAVGAHGDKSWTSILTIPRDRYFPNLSNCGLINMTYDLKAEAILPMPHSNLKATVPIKIGHIQFAGAQLDFDLGPPEGDDPIVINYSPTAPLPSTNQSPPSYSEAQMAKI